MQSDPNQIADLSAVHELIERDLLHFTFEKSDAQIFVFDGETLKFAAANAAARAATGHSMRTLRRKTPQDLLPWLGEDRLRRVLKRVALRDERPTQFRFALPTPNEGLVSLSLHRVHASKTSFVAYATHLPNIDDAVRMAALAEDRLLIAIEALSDAFVLFDKDDRLVICNERYRNIYRESAPAMVRGAKFEDILKYGLERDQYSLGVLSAEQWLAIRMEEHRNCNSVAEQRLADGRWLRIVERRTSDGGRVGLRVDITHQKEQQDELRRLTRADDLTGLLNRRGLTRRLQILSVGLSGSDRLAIMHIDLDRFKSVNDVYGHDAGDFVLAESARELTEFRPVPEAVARMGGDEFVLALHGDLSDDEISAHAHRIIENLNCPREFQHQNCQVGASIGIAFVGAGEAEDVKKQIIASDIALNEAKRLGGNQVVLFQPEMRDNILTKLDMAKDIRRGLANDEFLPHFQPQLDTATGRVVGFEALIRWRHPERGMIPAFKFLDVAQRVGLTEDIDNLMMDKSCEAVKTLLSWDLDPVRVSINLSLDQIGDPRILQRLQASMRKHQVEPENLPVELLESTLLDDRATVIINNVHKLIRAGFQVELDDFGTGHAAIATLRKFEVSRIKVDRSLVSEIDRDPELQVITSALIDLAQNLGIDALAEGVETADEQAKLCEMGCHVAQGYLHAKPMALEQVRGWLETRGDIPKSSAQA